MVAPRAFALAVVLTCAYGPLFHGEWGFMKSWDDDTNFIDNDLFRSLAPSHLWRMLSTTMINVWEPTAWLLKALVYAVFGLSPRAFRIASLVFHWLNAVLAAIVAPAPQAITRIARAN